MCASVLPRAAWLDASASRQVFCNGEEVLVTGGTKAEYIVDVWAGNHPFYQAGLCSSSAQWLF